MENGSEGLTDVGQVVRPPFTPVAVTGFNGGNGGGGNGVEEVVTTEDDSCEERPIVEWGAEEGRITEGGED